ncbi:coxsackie virus and adenovirus receptor [Chelydra serpentina]|uniref:Coxsackie virus and adenovirus receptor n=1 Tax=Chelydra serpentina TaxID=8475 RepID=A0A8T1SD18_CHESE|nr:coxsackie virus and adenovirus receptor [Chelydra serpentina]
MCPHPAGSSRGGLGMNFRCKNAAAKGRLQTAYFRPSSPCPRAVGWLLLLSVGIVSACQSAGLAPTGDRMVGAVGCTVVFPGPDHIDTTGFVRWEYKPNENDKTELSVVLYYVESLHLDILPAYQDRVVFNMSNWSLGLKLQLADRGLYRLRRQEEEKTGKWIQLEVIEPLSNPELFRNSSLAGSTIEMACNVTVGRVDSYQWRKDHKPLPNHYQLSRNNSVLLILNATQADTGRYSCKVTNEVSENETSLELTISDSSAVVSNGVILGVAVITAVIILVIADGDLCGE